MPGLLRLVEELGLTGAGKQEMQQGIRARKVTENFFKQQTRGAPYLHRWH
jgi:hypothetical protein